MPCHAMLDRLINVVFRLGPDARHLGEFVFIATLPRQRLQPERGVAASFQPDIVDVDG
jgi:hypothetical protein